MSSSVLLLVLFVLSAAASSEGSPTSQGPARVQKAAPAAERGDDELAVPVLPARRLTAAVPEPPPPLPAGAEGVQPLTLEVRVTTRAGARAQTRTQTVTRTADRVHVATATGVEWLFERNPVDPRRVAASAVQHAEKTIVVYSESDLRMTLGIPGWAHVLTMGVDARAVTAASGEARRVAGLPFLKTRVTTAGARGALWWNADQLLPLEYAGAGDGTSLSVVKIAPGVDQSRLRAPEARFPGYRVVEFADWLEEH
jgi:hypothetical protein